jgi:hypothetical protein
MIKTRQVRSISNNVERSVRLFLKKKHSGLELFNTGTPLLGIGVISKLILSTFANNGMM